MSQQQNPAPTLVASRYRVVRELGRGGMGVVYIVEHTRTGDQLALKLLHGRAAQDPQAIERFRREARASARIKSEHVVKVVDADVAPELDNAPFLVMELLDGTDLQHKVEQEGRLSPDQEMHLLVQAARALDKSHGVGIVHRDLKPENLFVHRREDGSSMLKILDFGISKILGGEAAGDMAGSGMTNTGAIMGTPLYMAPEQARGRVSEISPATDVWAMGLIGLFLLTGEIYWRANTVAELMVQILSDPMYPPTQRWPWLPQGMDAWFAKSCAREPRERFASVGQQVEALGVALGAHGGPALQRESLLPAVAPQVPAAAVTAPAPAGASTTAATAHEATTPRATGKLRPIVALVATVLVAAAAGSVLLLRGRDKAQLDTASAVTALPSGATATETSTPAPPPPAAPAAPATTAAAGEPPTAAAVSAQNTMSPGHPTATHAGQAVGHAQVPSAQPASAAAQANTKQSSAAAVAPPAAAASKPAANCNPPYAIDSAGHRQYKPECL